MPDDSAPRRTPLRGILSVLPGLLLALAIAGVAVLVSFVAPWAGAALPAIVIGVAIALIRRPGAQWAPGIRFASKPVLQISIVLLGSQLSLASILTVGAQTLPIMAATLLAAWVGASLVGRLLRVPHRERTLIGVGTAICGASAIAAIAPVIRAKSSEVAYAVATIFLFNVAAIAIFPAIGHVLDMPPEMFGQFAGTAVNDTSSVVAAASIYAPAALGVAVTVKLVRTLAIIPVSIYLAAREAQRSSEGERLTARRVFSFIPWFLFGFLVMAAVNTWIPLAPALTDGLTAASLFLIATAMAGIGLSTDLAALRAAGWRPLVLGAIVWALVTVVALLTLQLAAGWV